MGAAEGWTAEVRTRSNPYGVARRVAINFWRGPCLYTDNQSGVGFCADSAKRVNLLDINLKIIRLSRVDSSD